VSEITVIAAAGRRGRSAATALAVVVRICYVIAETDVASAASGFPLPASSGPDP
jgi:hypothetical protein